MPPRTEGENQETENEGGGRGGETRSGERERESEREFETRGEDDEATVRSRGVAAADERDEGISCESGG